MESKLIWTLFCIFWSPRAKRNSLKICLFVFFFCIFYTCILHNLYTYVYTYIILYFHYSSFFLYFFFLIFFDCCIQSDISSSIHISNLLFVLKFITFKVCVKLQQQNHVFWIYVFSFARIQFNVQYITDHSIIQFVRS